MNNVEKLASLFGSKAALARVCEVHPTIITRWTRRGEVPHQHHKRIKREAWALTASIKDAEKAEKMAQEILSCLPESFCPTCGRAHS